MSFPESESLNNVDNKYTHLPRNRLALGFVVCFPFYRVRQQRRMGEHKAF